MQKLNFKLRNRLIAGLFFFCVSFCCYGQSKLLFHKNRYREVLYDAGEYITIRGKGERKKFKGQIKEFRDTVIVFRGDYWVNPKNITHIYLDDKIRMWYAVRYKWARLFLIAGTGYFLLDTINSGEVKEETLLISGS